MTREDLRLEATALLDIIARRMALRTPPAPSGRAVDVAAYLTAYRAMTATFGTPGQAQQTAVQAWQQAGADLTPDARAALQAAVGAPVAGREGGA